MGRRVTGLKKPGDKLASLLSMPAEPPEKISLAAFYCQSVEKILMMTNSGPKSNAATMTKSSSFQKNGAKPLVQKPAYSFERFLIFTAICTIIICSFEGLSEKYIPQISILNFLHSQGLLLGYDIIYEPGKGIWIDLGWTGSILMVLMMFYSIRKRVSLFHSFGSLRKWLSVHMLFGIVGPILITFHTTFKFNGIIATSFWCMIVTMVFGILGRYIYIQIPRNLSGTELAVNDIEDSVQSLGSALDKTLGHDNLLSLMTMIDSGKEEMEKLSPLNILFLIIKMDIKNVFNFFFLRKKLRTDFKMSKKMQKDIVSQLKRRANLIRKKRLLATSHKLLHYWHVLHVPLAIVMFIILFIHVTVHYLFRPVS